jgi:hypothetical protein
VVEERPVPKPRLGLAAAVRPVPAPRTVFFKNTMEDIPQGVREMSAHVRVAQKFIMHCTEAVELPVWECVTDMEPLDRSLAVAGMIVGESCLDCAEAIEQPVFYTLGTSYLELPAVEITVMTPRFDVKKCIGYLPILVVWLYCLVSLALFVSCCMVDRDGLGNNLIEQMPPLNNSFDKYLAPPGEDIILFRTPLWLASGVDILNRPRLPPDKGGGDAVGV